MSDLSNIPQNNDIEIVGNSPLDRNPAAVYLARLAEGSKRSQHGALDRMAGLLTKNEMFDCYAFPWHSLRYQHTAALRAHVADLYAPATANKFLSALRGVLKEAWRLGLMTAEDYRRAADLQSVRGKREPAGHDVTKGDISALISICMDDKKTSSGVRDAAIIAFMYACGPRRQEVAMIVLKNYNQKTGQLRIIGKGNKERFVYLQKSNGAYEAMADWLTIRGPETGPLFYPINKGGHIVRQIQEISPQAIYNILHKRGIEASIAKFSPHDLRRTFVSEMLDAGADISTIAKLAGHANVTTTARYDRRNEETKRKAAGLIHVPYVNH